MKRWLIGVLLMLLIVLCVGCGDKSQKTNEQKPGNDEIENQSDEEKADMTERQEEVFRNYGLSEEKIEKMKADGLSYKEQSFVDTAIMMLDYLGEKYALQFKAVGGDIPGVLSDEYWITAEASEGEYAGKKFDVYYLGEDGFKDGYITIIKQEEARTALNKLITSEFDNVLVFPSLTGEYGSELTLDNTGDEMLKIVSYYCDFVISKPEISEEEFINSAKSIEEFLNDNDVFTSGSALYFHEPVEQDMSRDELNKRLDSDDALKWSYYISSR